MHGPIFILTDFFFFFLMRTGESGYHWTIEFWLSGVIMLWVKIFECLYQLALKTYHVNVSFDNFHQFHYHVVKNLHRENRNWVKEDVCKEQWTVYISSIICFNQRYFETDKFCFYLPTLLSFFFWLDVSVLTFFFFCLNYFIFLSSPINSFGIAVGTNIHSSTTLGVLP